jgi:hypothetical protein
MHLPMPMSRLSEPSVLLGNNNACRNDLPNVMLLIALKYHTRSAHIDIKMKGSIKRPAPGFLSLKTCKARKLRNIDRDYLSHQDKMR